jgi:hypothetical protein
VLSWWACVRIRNCFEARAHLKRKKLRIFLTDFVGNLYLVQSCWCFFVQCVLCVSSSFASACLWQHVWLFFMSPVSPLLCVGFQACASRICCEYCLVPYEQNSSQTF